VQNLVTLSLLGASPHIGEINVKNEVYKNGYRRRGCTSKTVKIYRFVRFVMYCFITTVLVAFYYTLGQRSLC